MRYVLIALLFMSCSKDVIEKTIEDFNPVEEAIIKIDVKDIGAAGNNVQDDWPVLQKAIDSAIKVNGRVIIPKGTYRISKPLVAANWTGSAYGFCKVEIEGDSRMWDLNNGTIIIPDFTDKFALGLHLNKGSIIKGIEIRGKYRSTYTLTQHMLTELADYRGDTICRDSQYSPYAGVVIDPFRGVVPPDGGYPGMTEWYRGSDNTSGSTGIRFEDMTVDRFVVGYIVSPNGKTLNGELITWENIRIGESKVGIAGCQAQEKLNRIVNLGAWSRTHTLLGWGVYGQGHPGHYAVDGLNIAGEVRQLVYRPSQDWFPLHMTNVFAERLFTIGMWNGYAGDSFSESIVDFFLPGSQVPAFPNWHMQSTGTNRSVALSNVVLMYYGRYKWPVFLRGNYPLFNSPNRQIYALPVHAFRYDNNKPDTLLTQVYQGFPVFYDSASNKKTRINAAIKTGDIVFFIQANNNDYMGMGEVESDGLIRYCSPQLKNGIQYRIFKYK